MTAAWMLYVLLVGTLLACAALAVDVALRRTGLPTRWVWALAMAGSVALAGLAPRGRSLPQAFDLSSIPMRATAAPTAPAPRSIATALRGSALELQQAIAHGIAQVERRVPERVSLPLGLSWIAFSLSLFVLLVTVNRRVDRARRSWPVGRMHDTAVRIAPDIGPAVVGVSRPEIVVPQWLLHRSDEEQRLVVVHEGEHVAARDQVLLVGAWCAAALLPWHPAVWWMLSRLRLAIELDCDARVLHRGVSPRPYGALLIDIAGQCAGLRIGALALADKTTHLERRLIAMKTTRSRFIAARATVLGSIAVLSVLVACEARMPTSSEVSGMDVASAERNAVQAKLLAEKSAVPAIYTVDGVVVSEAEAKSLMSGKIASIEIMKSKVPGQAARIAVRTNTAGTLGKVEAEKGGVRFKVASDSLRVAGGTAQAMRVRISGDSGARSAAVIIDGINTRMAADTSIKVAGYAIRSDSLRRRTSEMSSTNKPMVVIDGVVSPDGMNKLNPNDIESVEVIKGPAALALYPDAQYGVIEIKTKTAKP